MLEEQEIIDGATSADILDALDAIEEAGYDALPDGAEDVHEAIESAVIDRVGPSGGAMHTARSRNDEVATCIRYRLRTDVLSIIEAIVGLREALLETVEAGVDTVMPGYTHLQPAQPITVAHWAMSYERALARDTERLAQAYQRINRSPLGGVAFAGTPFTIDRDRTAELLGFEDIVMNAMDATASRDVVAETLGGTAILAVTLSGIAEDLILFAHRGFLELDDAYASTSSIMPQKKNPDSLELVRAITGDATGSLVGFLTALKGLPRAYNRDLQQATTHLWGTVDLTAEASRVCAGAIQTAEWDVDRLAEAADEGFATATGLADALARNGIPFRQAHEIVAKTAEVDSEDRVMKLEKTVQEVTGESLATFVPGDELEDILTPAGSVASRDSAGGPAPAAMSAQLAEARDTLRSDIAELEALREDLSEADAQLEQEVRSRV